MGSEHRPPAPPGLLGADFGSDGGTIGSGEREKDWDRHVRQADELSRTPGFRDLRDRIVAKAAPVATEQALDIGCGTGLLALALAPTCRGVWAIDVAPAMVEHLRWVIAGERVANVYPLVASAAALPQADASIDVAVSNYCFHHLDEAGKRQTLAEIHRVLRPGGRLVFADMMFGWSPAVGRNREVLGAKVRAISRRGPAGWLRLASNAGRLLTGRGEHPAAAEWWRPALLQAGFDEIEIELLSHEGGIAAAVRPG